MDELTGEVSLKRDISKTDSLQLLAAKRGVADMPGPAQPELDESVEYSVVSTMVWGKQGAAAGTHGQSGRPADEPSFTKAMQKPEVDAKAGKGGGRSKSPKRSKSPASPSTSAPDAVMV